MEVPRHFLVPVASPAYSQPRTVVLELILHQEQLTESAPRALGWLRAFSGRGPLVIQAVYYQVQRPCPKRKSVFLDGEMPLRGFSATFSCF